MFSLLTQYILFHKSQPAAAVADKASVAQGLMESADAHAGRDPRHAAELRSAAMAALSAVR
ncbi:hypothetical protein [Rhodoferax sp.]|uniref:hypothetical protein n=1 Tax=Rhodoferax sp. TaxID=50421 RepID=UPI0025F4A62A|nr:hypothetical protein [Rhodoferax sp.]